ncbi:FAD-dependent oxidoreductase [Streptomyces sp. NPDC002446]
MSEQPGPQVLVVGAGPVGLTAAHELARRGLRVRLIDAAEGPARTSRAVAVHPRTLETLDQMGAVDGVLRHGRKNRAFTMYAGGRRLMRLEADYTSMPTRYPYTVLIEQTATEAVLREAVARQGVEIEWGVRLTGLEHDGQEVRARLATAHGGEEICRTAWLVGCDGGHSTVRSRLGLPLRGGAGETWMLADAPVRCDLPPDSIYWAHTGGRALMMVPYARAGHWRLLDTAPPATAVDDQEIARRFSAALGAALGREVEVGEPEWTSVFTFQQRMVPAMGRGRCFVAGDAAHVHGPASGQGMNTGIQEAYNLAWKLAMVEQGHAGPELLASYGIERVPVGERLLGSTRTATFLVQLKNLLASAALPVVSAGVRRLPPLRRALQRKVLGGMSGLLLEYHHSPLTATEPVEHLAPLGPVNLVTPALETAPAPGERVTVAGAHDDDDPGCRALREELRDPRWSLLLAAGGHGPEGGPEPAAHAAAERYGPWLSVRTIGATGQDALGGLPDPAGRLRSALGLRPGGWLLVRPDGYLAARGNPLTTGELERALAPVHLRAAPSPTPPAARPRPGVEVVSGTSQADRDTVKTTPSH